MSSSTPSGPAAPSRRSALIAVYLAVFLDVLGFGLILPSLPFFARDLGASATVLGILLASYSAAQMIGSMVLGRLSDQWGRRPALLISLAGVNLAMAGSAFADTLVTLAVARIVGGFFAGSIGVGQAYIADVTSAEDRPKRMGLLGAAIGSGFVLGPSLGAAASVVGIGFPGAALAAASIGTVNLVLAWLRLEETRARSDRPSRLWGLKTAAMRPALRRVLGATFFSTMAFVGMETTLAYYIADHFELGSGAFGMLMGVMAVILVVIQGGAIGRLTPRFGVRRLAVVGALIMAVGLAGVAAAPVFGAVMAALAVMAVGQGLTLPTLSTMLSYGSDADRQGAVLGAGRSMSAAARAVGPLGAGYLYDIVPTGAFWASVGLAAIAAWMAVGGSDGTEG